MKCKYCGGNLDLEHKFCPHCGRPNELAQQHIRDMEKYRGEFDRTQQDVYRHASRWSGIAARAIILAVIVVMFFIMAFVTQNAWSIKSEHMTKSANRHYAEYSAQLDKYLENMDYRGFSSFLDYHQIDTYDPTYNKYYGLEWPADSYGSILKNIMNIVMPTSYGAYERQYEYLSEDLDRFYQYTAPSFYGDYHPVDEKFVKPHWDRMEQTINDVLITYLGFSKEEAWELRNLSKPKRALLLEEKIEALLAE